MSRTSGPITDHMVVNVNVLGVGQRPAAWRNPELHARSILDLDYWQTVARAAEKALVDAVFIADRPAMTDPRTRPVQYLEPTVQLTAMAAVTEHVGFVGTASTTLNTPEELAVRLYSLHVASRGRYAWNAVTTYDPEAVRNFGHAAVATRETRYARGEEVIRAVRALWESAGTGETVSFHGDYVDMEATLPAAVTFPGHPVIVQAGGSMPGKRLAGRVADAVYSVEQDLEAGVESRELVRRLAAEEGRSPDAVRVYPGLALVIGSTEAEAWERFDHWENLAPPTYSLQALSAALGEDLSDVDLDAPLPARILDAEPSAEEFAGWSLGYRNTLVRMARRSGAPVRKLLREFGGYGQRFLAGTPEQIADTMEEWFRAGAADGFNLMLDLFPSALEDYAEQVVPELQRRGLIRREYTEGTLRDRFTNP